MAQSAPTLGSIFFFSFFRWLVPKCPASQNAQMTRTLISNTIQTIGAPPSCDLDCLYFEPVFA